MFFQLCEVVKNKNITNLTEKPGITIVRFKQQQSYTGMKANICLLSTTKL